MKKTADIVLSALSALYILPVAVTVFCSFLYGGSFGFSRYYGLFTCDYPYFRYFLNSALYSFASSAVCIVISLPLGLALAKIRFRFRDTVFMMFVVIMMMPFQAAMLPDYIVLRDLNMLNTRAALILPSAFSPLAVFLLRQFIIAIPDEQLDAAVMETSSPAAFIFVIILPQIKSAIFVLFILLFCESWNMLEQALVFSPQNIGIYPLSAMMTGIPDDVRFAGAALYMLPMIILFVLQGKTVYGKMEYKS